MPVDAETTIHTVDDISLNSSRHSSFSNSHHEGEGSFADKDAIKSHSNKIALSSSHISLFLLFAQKFCMNAATFIFYGASFFILVPAYNISISWTTAVAYLTVLMSTYTTVFVGYYGDHIVSKFGKRKPLVVVGYAIACIGYLMMAQLNMSSLFSVPAADAHSEDGSNQSALHTDLVGYEGSPKDGTTNMNLMIWYLSAEMVLTLGISLYTIPFSSWIMESCLDNDDYSTVQLYCFNAGTAGGSLCGILTLYQAQADALAIGAVIFIGAGGGGLGLLLFYLGNSPLTGSGGSIENTVGGEGGEEEKDIANASGRINTNTNSSSSSSSSRSMNTTALTNSEASAFTTRVAVAVEANSGGTGDLVKPSLANSNSVGTGGSGGGSCIESMSTRERESIDLGVDIDVDKPHMLPSLRMLYGQNPEFKQLLYNSIILSVGEGLGTEFVSFVFIIFPSVKHYKRLVQLATFFFFAQFVLGAACTAITKKLFLEYMKVDKLVVLRKIIQIFICVCGVEVLISIPSIVQEAGGGEDVLDADSDAAWSVVYVYLGLQVMLASLFQTASAINTLLIRDVIRLDELRTGTDRYNTFQAALTVPSLIIVTFFIAVPQAVFYSSGYNVLPYTFGPTTSTNGTDATIYVDDDLISSKWEWTKASFYEILLFQNVLSAVLAIIAFYVLQDYALDQRIADDVDSALFERSAFLATGEVVVGVGQGVVDIGTEIDAVDAVETNININRDRDRDRDRDRKQPSSSLGGNPMHMHHASNSNSNINSSINASSASSAPLMQGSPANIFEDPNPAYVPKPKENIANIWFSIRTPPSYGVRPGGTTEYEDKQLMLHFSRDEISRMCGSYWFNPRAYVVHGTGISASGSISGIFSGNINSNSNSNTNSNSNGGGIGGGSGSLSRGRSKPTDRYGGSITSTSSGTSGAYSSRVRGDTGEWVEVDLPQRLSDLHGLPSAPESGGWGASKSFTNHDTGSYSYYSNGGSARAGLLSSSHIHNIHEHEHEEAGFDFNGSGSGHNVTTSIPAPKGLPSWLLLFCNEHINPHLNRMAYGSSALIVIQRFHKFGLVFLAPASIISLICACVEQTVARTASPYLPLLVNLLSLCFAYFFYELLRAGAVSDLWKVVMDGTHGGVKVTAPSKAANKNNRNRRKYAANCSTSTSPATAGASGDVVAAEAEADRVKIVEEGALRAVRILHLGVKTCNSRFESLKEMLVRTGGHLDSEITKYDMVPIQRVVPIGIVPMSTPSNMSTQLQGQAQGQGDSNSNSHSEGEEGEEGCSKSLTRTLTCEIGFGAAYIGIQSFFLGLCVTGLLFIYVI